MKELDTHSLLENFRNNGFLASYFATAKEAADYLCGSISGTTVGIGGSVTVDQLGLYDRLAGNNDVFWHWKQQPQDEARAKAANAEVYITSANGISMNGEVVNIDGSGNRVASMCFGHDRLYIVAGLNKVEKELESAVSRAKNVAAPLNAIRLKRKTPCALSEEHKCYDCRSPERICAATTILTRKPFGIQTVEVILIGEELGF